MTTTEIKTALTAYAKEDTQLAIENESMAITGTKSGVISLNHKNDKFQAFNNMGVKLTGKMERPMMINWLVDQYEIEA